MVGSAVMKLRKILKVFNNYCKTFKDVPPGNSDNKKPAPGRFFVSR